MEKYFYVASYGLGINSDDFVYSAIKAECFCFLWINTNKGMKHRKFIKCLDKLPINTASFTCELKRNSITFAQEIPVDILDILVEYINNNKKVAIVSYESLSKDKSCLQIIIKYLHALYNFTPIALPILSAGQLSLW